MANAVHDAPGWIPEVIQGLSALPPQITLPIAAFLLAGFAIWAMHSVAKGRS